MASWILFVTHAGRRALWGLTSWVCWAWTASCVTGGGRCRDSRQWGQRIEPRLDLGSDSAADLLCGLGGSILSRPQLPHLYVEGMLAAWVCGHWVGEEEWPTGGSACTGRKGGAAGHQGALDTLPLPFSPLGNNPVSTTHIATVGSGTPLGLSVSKPLMTVLGL